MEFMESVRYPTASDDWVPTVLIGGALLIFGFLLVPLLAVYGYLVRAIRASLTGSREPPSFGDWGDLLIDGLQAWLVSVVYMLVPAVVATVTVGGSIAAMLGGGRAGAAAGFGGLLLGGTLSVVLVLVFGYLAGIGIVNFAREERFGAAFDLGTIKTVALDRSYATAWLLSVVVFLAAGLLGAVPLVGWLLAPFATFYAAVVAANLWAGGFEAATVTPSAYHRSGEHDPVA